MVKILTQVRLPLKIAKGTNGERKMLAENLLHNFANRIEPEFNKRKELSLDRVQAVLRESLPYKRIVVETIQSENGNGNNFLLHVDDFGRLDALALELETNIKGKVGLNQRNSLYHEAFHFFDAITNPKVMARTFTFEDDVLLQYLDFYHTNFYSKRRYGVGKLSHKLDKFLEKFRDDEKVNLLQQLRYDLQGELDAYTKANALVPERNNYEAYSFPKKIELVTRKLRELLQELRGLNANK